MVGPSFHETTMIDDNNWEKERLVAVLSLTCLWVGSFTGMYVTWQLIKYLQVKPENLQSQLDIVYQVMFQFWILDNHLHLEPHIFHYTISLWSSLGSCFGYCLDSDILQNSINSDSDCRRVFQTNDDFQA